MKELQEESNGNDEEEKNGSTDIEVDWSSKMVKIDLAKLKKFVTDKW